MYEEFDDGTSFNVGRQRSQGLLESVTSSFIGLFSPPSIGPGYEPLGVDFEYSTSNGYVAFRSQHDMVDHNEEYPRSLSQASGLQTVASVESSVIPQRSNIRHKSFYLNNATLGSCVLNLVSTIVGSGVLGLSYAFSKTGWVLGVFLVISCSLLSMFSLHLLSICGARSQPISAQAILKDTHFLYGIMVELSIFVSSFGACLSYLLVIGGLMSSLVDGYGSDVTIWTHRYIWTGIGFALVAPFCYFESFDTLKYTSALSIIFVSFVAFIMVLYACPIREFDPCPGTTDEHEEDCKGENYYISLSWDTFRGLSIFVFSFSGSQVTFS